MDIDITRKQNKIFVTINGKKVRWGKQFSYILTGIKFADVKDGICTINNNPIAGQIYFRGESKEFILPVLSHEQTDEEFVKNLVARKEIIDGIKEWIVAISKTTRNNIFSRIKRVF